MANIVICVDHMEWVGRGFTTMGAMHCDLHELLSLMVQGYHSMIFMNGE